MQNHNFVRMGDGERVLMSPGQIKEDLDIGIITAVAGSAKGIAAKWKIAELLDIEINSVNHFKSKLS